MTSPGINVVVADSNQLIRCGLSAIFIKQPDINLVGEASDAESLQSILLNFHVDVVLIDFVAPGFSIDIVPKCSKVHPSVKFVAITTEQTGQTIVHALKAGIYSYIKKDCDINEIVSSVRDTASGGRFFCGQILETLQREAIDPEDQEIKDFTCEPVSLTNRELEIIGLIAEGMTNVQIAEKLFLSNHTINTHRKNIMAKLGVNNTASIVMYAVKTKLVSPNKFLFSPFHN